MISLIIFDLQKSTILQIKALDISSLVCLFDEGPEEYKVLFSNGPPLIREVSASSPKALKDFLHYDLIEWNRKEMRK